MLDFLLLLCRDNLSRMRRSEVKNKKKKKERGDQRNEVGEAVERRSHLYPLT